MRDSPIIAPEFHSAEKQLLFQIAMLNGHGLGFNGDCDLTHRLMLMGYIQKINGTWWLTDEGRGREPRRPPGSF